MTDQLTMARLFPLRTDMAAGAQYHLADLDATAYPTIISDIDLDGARHAGCHEAAFDADDMERRISWSNGRRSVIWAMWTALRPAMYRMQVRGVAGVLRRVVFPG
jgi:hypothetical protein